MPRGVYNRKKARKGKVGRPRKDKQIYAAISDEATVLCYNVTHDHAIAQAKQFVQENPEQAAIVLKTIGIAKLSQAVYTETE